MEPIDLQKSKGEFFTILHTTPRSQLGAMTLSPGQDSGPEETHDGDQIVYVVEGEVDVTISGELLHLSKGTAVTIPAKAQHHLYNRSSKAAFLLTIYAPPAY